MGVRTLLIEASTFFIVGADVLCCFVCFSGFEHCSSIRVLWMLEYCDERYPIHGIDDDWEGIGHLE